MAYVFELSVPSGTTEQAPAKQVIDILPCIIEEVTLIHPAGCVGLVGTWFLYQSHQLYPFNAGARFKGNGASIPFKPKTEITEPPFQLTMLSFNDDDTYAHTVYAIIEVTLLEARKGGVVEQWGSALANLFLPGRG